MPSIYDLKPRFVQMLQPLAALVQRVGLTANHITVLAAFLSVAMGVWLYVSGGAVAALWAVPPVLLGRMILNALDGMLARQYGQASPLGAILNEMGDVTSDAALYLPFALLVAPELVILLVLAAVLVEMIGVVPVLFGARRQYAGPFGKSDRAVAFGALSLVLALGWPVAGWISYALAAALVLSALTMVNRARQALREVNT